jgi:hypothetical protein
MSETESYKSPEFDESSEFDQEEDNYVNERIDRYSEDSSDYHVSAQVDPSSTNKKYVIRVNQLTKKPTRVYFFPTNSSPNSIIKHAMTGVFQSDEGKYYRVGSRDEDLFFSTLLATGEIGQTAPLLFYDNPEQYERHFFTKVSQQIKDKWTEKRNAALYFVKRNHKETVGGGDVVVK